MTWVTQSGPLFDGRAALAAGQAADAIARDVGKAAQDRVRANTAVFRHPTGAYRARITLDARGNVAEVHDRNCVYGPWLEGTGSRNRTTRFKGYHFWRKAGQEADARAKPVAEQTLQPYLRRMQ